MQNALIVTAATMMTMLNSCDSGLHLGNFKNDCAANKGALSVVEGTSNEYRCTLPDGNVLFSKTK